MEPDSLHPTANQLHLLSGEQEGGSQTFFVHVATDTCLAGKMGGPARTYKRETLTHSNVFRFATSITIIGTGSRQQTYAHNTHRFTGSTFAPSLLLCFLTHPGRDIYLNTATIHHSTELSRRELSRVEPAASLWCFAARFGAR